MKKLFIITAIAMFPLFFTPACAGNGNDDQDKKARSDMEYCLNNFRLEDRDIVYNEREVNEKELAWYMTWHESDYLLYDNNGYVMFYSDTAKDKDYVWIYKVN